MVRALFKSIAIEWTGNELKLIDQRKIPLEEIWVECRDHVETARAIKDMVVRGAPAIGVSAAFGYVLGFSKAPKNSKDELIKYMKEVKKILASSRPTAVNLFWALDRMEKKLEEVIEKDFDEILKILENEALEIANEDLEMNKQMGRNGLKLFEGLKDVTLLTHCNAGALATSGYGTALGVIRALKEAGKNVKVFVDETRPYLQGARLTAWELVKSSIEAVLICDNMAGWVMKQGWIDAIIVGADRIAANGDVANKIGTYSLAVLAKNHGIPFYVAAPYSTIDLSTPDGSKIPIEERSHEEVTHIMGKRIAPEGVKVFNPAFDVTDNELITAIITEKGVITQPYSENLKKLFER
jgi:methylthioribose-1-phosphate isomerase